MSPFAMLLVVASAMLHAGWNLMCKTRKSPGPVFFLMFTCCAVALWLPFAAWSVFAGGVAIPSRIWWLLLASGLANAVYYVSVGEAYRAADMSLAYPLIKAIPIIMVTAFCAFFGGGWSSGFGVAGVLVLTAGSLLMPMKKFGMASPRDYMNRAFAFVMAAATASACYMLLDNEGMRLLKEANGAASLGMAMFYLFFENLFILPFLLAIVTLRKEGRAQLKEELRSLSARPLVAGGMCTVSYSLVLFAMSLSTNVGMVVTLRQLSVPIGAAAGILLLKEPAFAPKIAGATFIMGGLALACLR